MEAQEKILSLSAVGLDAPGLVAQITRRVYRLGGNIIDVEENCRRGLFSIFLIVDFSAAGKPLDEIEEALEHLQEPTGLKVIVARHSHPETPSCAPVPENHLVSIIGEDRPGIIARVSDWFARHTVNIENCRMIARGRFFSMEMIVDTSRLSGDGADKAPPSLDGLWRGLKSRCAEIGQSVVVQSGNIQRRARRLVVFDVEEALIRNFSLQRFLAGVRRRIRGDAGTATEAAGPEDPMRALIENARALKGIPIEDLRRLSDMLQLAPGTLELIRILRSMGFKVALISSGFHFFIKKIFETARVDYAFSNTLEADEKGITTGGLAEPIITGDTKQEILEFIMGLEGIGPERVIAVGGGDERSRFIRGVGLSIAFQPEQPCLSTDGCLKGGSILDVLYCLGLPEAELERCYAGAFVSDGGEAAGRPVAEKEER